MRGARNYVVISRKIRGYLEKTAGILSLSPGNRVK